MNISELLKLLGQKYPASSSARMYPALLIFDDGSGRIVKDAGEDAYAHNSWGDSTNVLFEFSKLDELLAHLAGEVELPFNEGIKDLSTD